LVYEKAGRVYRKKKAENCAASINPYYAIETSMAQINAPAKI